MGTLWPYVRAELRRRALTLALLGAVVAVAAGAATATLAGASRTTSALERLRASADASDALVQYPFDDDTSEADLGRIAEQLRALPGVAAVGEVRQFFLFVDDGAFDSADISFGNLSTASVDGSYGRTVDRGRLLAGERPAPDDALAASVSEGLATRLGLAPGDELRVGSLSMDQLQCIFTGCALTEPEGPRLTLRVAAVERFPIEALAPQNPQQLLLTPAFVAEHGDAIANFGSLYAVRLADGLDGVERLRGQLGALVEQNGDDPGELYVTGALDDSAGIVEAADAVAVGLRVFAAIATIAGLAVVAQAMARHLAAAAADTEVLLAIGVTRRQRSLATLAVLAVPVVAGSVAAAVLAIALSPLFPLGQARAAEPDPGVDVDAGYALLGPVAAVLVLGAVAALVQWRAAGAGRGASSASVAAGLMAAAPPTVAAGVRAALLGRGAARVQALGGCVVALVLVVGALVFSASLGRFVESPQRDGWAWDLEVSVGDELDDAAALADAEGVAGESGIDAVLLARILELEISGVPVTAFGTQRLEGDIGLSVVSGRAPAASGELALGAATRRAAGVGVGDHVDLPGLQGRPRRFTVVGEARFPLIEGDDPDTGVWMGIEDLASLATASEGFPTILASVGPGDDTGVLVERLRAVHTFVDDEPRRSSDANNLSQLTGHPLALALLAAVLGAGALAHTLLVGVRRRRSELAVLRAVGMTSGQVASTVAWQAIAVAVAGLAVGVPLGLAAGRTTWSTLARSIGAADDPLTPLAVALVVPATMAIALALAAWPARAARRIHPAIALRRD